MADGSVSTRVDESSPVSASGALADLERSLAAVVKDTLERLEPALEASLEARRANFVQLGEIADTLRAVVQDLRRDGPAPVGPSDNFLRSLAQVRAEVQATSADATGEKSADAGQPDGLPPGRLRDVERSVRAQGQALNEHILALLEELAQWHGDRPPSDPARGMHHSRA
jgi:hypothetical protein